MPRHLPAVKLRPNALEREGAVRISRRGIVKGIAGGVPLATILADPMHVTVYAYDANHAFANPTGAAFPYVKEAADLAWKRALAFLKKYD
jgi:dienelactone hydrolase